MKIDIQGSICALRIRIRFLSGWPKETGFGSETLLYWENWCTRTNLIMNISQKWWLNTEEWKHPLIKNMLVLLRGWRNLPCIKASMSKWHTWKSDHPNAYARFWWLYCSEAHFFISGVSHSLWMLLNSNKPVSLVFYNLSH